MKFNLIIKIYAWRKIKNFKPILFCLFSIAYFFGLLGNSSAENNLRKFEKKFKVDKQAGKLLFLGDDGIIFKEFPLQKWVLGKSSPSEVSVADNGKFVCVTTVTKEDVSGEDVIEGNSIVLDYKGNEIWKVKHTSSNSIVAPNGRYIICGDNNGPDKIYYQTGKVVLVKDDSLSEYQYSYNGDSQYSFSNDGSFVVGLIRATDLKKDVLLHKQGGRWGEGDITELIAIDENGRELWKKADLPRGRGVIPTVKVLEDNKVQVTLFSVQSRTKRFRYYGSNGEFIGESSVDKS